MSRPTKSLDPTDRMGIFKSLSEVPSRYRLANHNAAYRGRNVWQEFCDEYEYSQGNYDRYTEEVDRVGDHWLEFMQDRGNHHALATPDDVEMWCAKIYREEDMSLRRSHDYWLRINRFYEWLKWHTDHPHVYNPALLAVNKGQVASKIWDKKVEKVRNARRKYRESSP